MAKKVLVTGASGQTGALVFEKLVASPEFEALGMVRSEFSAQSLKQKVNGAGNVVLAHLDKPDTVKEAMKGMDSLVILTSAMPQLNKWSLVPVIFWKMLGYPVKPTFHYHPGQSPEIVDWAGQKTQIDCAKEMGIKHVVLVSSMATTIPDHFLNTMGDGNILLWKRKAEKYLMASGLKYTIIHPGGLLPHPGPSPKPVPGGKRELVVAVDDMLIPPEGTPAKNNVIPREDVAEVVVQSLITPEAANRSFDLGSKPEGEGTVWNKNLTELLATLNGANCKYDEPDWP